MRLLPSLHIQLFGSRLARLLCIFLVTGVTHSVDAATWYVKATATSGGNGSEDEPFDSLADAEAASGAGDTIYIMHSHSGVVLDGQIILKPDQKLIGTGPDVRRVPENAAGARITYSGGGGEGYPDGAIIQLSSDNEIANIHFKDMSFGGIVGIDVDFSGANIHDNLFTGGNIDNGWIRISVLLESSSGNSNVVVRDNVFRDGNFLGGIRAFHRGDSSGTYDFEGNHFDNMGFRPYFFWTFDTASLQADILDSSANNIGALGEFSEFANSDSILMQLSGSSDMDVLVDGYTYDNTGQFGGISNTGLELFIFGSGFGAPELGANNAHVTLKINKSSFSNAVTEAIQVLNLGIDSLMEIEITNTVVTDANPRQLGAFFGVGGAAISVIPEFFGNSGSLTSLMIENCDVIGSSAYAVGIYDFGTSGFSSVVDMGGGALGSIGHNRVLDNVVGEIELFQTDGIGKSNWWGEDPPRIDIDGGGSFDIAPVLLADPRP